MSPALASRRGFALLTALICLLLILLLALTAASLSLLARRGSAAALGASQAEALAESEPAAGLLPIPAVAGQRLTVAEAPPEVAWVRDWTVTRLGGNLLLVRGSARLLAPDGHPLAATAVARLLLCCDSLPPTPLPGGWLGIP